jgi:hypothetical protein
MLFWSIKKDKSEVNYSTGTPAEHCGNCQFFLKNDDACRRVRGMIVARMWCDLWSGKLAKAA